MMMTVQTITPKDLSELLARDEPIDLIDVRTPAEYESAHVEAASNVPLDALDTGALAKQRKGSSESPVYVICQSGARSRQACEKLCKAGLAAVSIEGGTPACERAGLAVKHGRRVISLERQVRIAAGAVVAVGTLLSAVVSPWFLVVPGFVGCGLIFAGVTDWCGMGMLLAKMPWNRAGACASCGVKTVTSH